MLDGGEATEQIFFVKGHLKAGADTAERRSGQRNCTAGSANKTQQMESSNVQYGIRTGQMTKENNPANNTDECRIREDGLLCLAHNCVVKRIKVTSKRWNWNKKRKCYGWKSFKVDRFICMERRAGINKTQNNTSDSNDSESGLGNLGGAGRSENRHEVGGSLLNLVKNVGSESGLSALD